MLDSIEERKNRIPSFRKKGRVANITAFFNVNNFVLNKLTNWKILNQRKNIRIETKSGIAMTPNGVCRITNLSKDGCALKCLNAWGFPSEWTMDLYDGAGLNLKELKVRKVWTKRPSTPSNLLYSEVEVGGVFEDLSLSQEAQLYGHLLELIAAEKNI